ncbi:MAG: hypothetical protein PHD61_11635 [Bacteroidales bacterium]|nr:hypothetical protein [Lentimicrobiaceae bacterium]MDD5695940.1 hypothetical protein [Bacteroidales bacterium]
MQCLLAVDLGVRTGFALYDSDGKLLWYRSRNYGNKYRLRGDIQNMLSQIPFLSVVILEGGGDIARIWLKECQRRNLKFIQIYAEDWRKDLFNPKDFRTGEQAKLSAIRLAKKIISQCSGPKPTSMLDDAAEAILIGYWGVHLKRSMDLRTEEQSNFDF